MEHSSIDESSVNIRLVYFIRLIRSLQQRLEDKKMLLSDKLEELRTLDSKRTNLMKQNFASSTHLEKTHTRYWNNCQTLIIEIEYIRKEILEIENAIEENLEIYHNIKNELDLSQKLSKSSS